MSLEIGDHIFDNDPRVLRWRVLRVTGFEESKPTHRRPARTRAICVEIIKGRECGTYKILADRIHIDGKPRRSGFSRITPEDRP